MYYYHECPICHAALDPGEHCDCANAAPADEIIEIDDQDPDEEERM